MSAITTTQDRKLDELAGACDRAPDELALFEEVSRRLNEVVPFDGACWFATDPATVLASSAVRVENVEQGHCESFWERECTGRGHHPLPRPGAQHDRDRHPVRLDRRPARRAARATASSSHRRGTATSCVPPSASGRTPGA